MHFAYSWRSRETIAFPPLVTQSKFFLVTFKTVDRLDQSDRDPEISGRVQVVTKCLSFNRKLYAAQVGTIVAQLNDFNTLQTVSSAE